ncbi:MAG: gamma-glutamylcyclotransferase family protein [Candidatus Woesearchaeota archaeon]
MEDQYVFVYGLLKSHPDSFKSLYPHLEYQGSARTRGVLVMHMHPEKRYPFLLYDNRTLQQFQGHTGIETHEIKGELYKIKDPEALDQMDKIEGVDPFTEYPRPRYIRTTVNTISDKGPRKAWAYIANPAKDHTKKLFKRTGTKVIIPEGDWQEYIKEQPRPDQNTFGTETEFSLYAHDTQEGWKKLPHLKNHGKYKVNFHNGSTLRYKNLTTLLSQTLYHHLQKKDLGRRVLGYYYEKKPQVNNHFPIPFGFAYIEGESLPEDGTKVAVRRLYPVEVRKELRGKYKAPVIESLAAEDRFLECSGFPIRMQPGSGTRYARHEMTRRYFLCKALEEIESIEFNGNTIDKLEIRTHSSHFNHKLDPTFQHTDLSRIRTRLAPSHKTPTEESKFTSDVAKVLGSTMGPLITYMSSGKPGHIEYKVRPDNRLEFRSTPIHSIKQLQAAYDVFSASTITAQKRIKQGLDLLIEDEFKKPSSRVREKDILEFYDSLEYDAFLDQFPVHLPVDYKDSIFKYGYLLEEPYAEGTIDTSKGALHDIIKELWNDEIFHEVIQSITNKKEYENIMWFLENPERVESFSPSRDVTSSYMCKSELDTEELEKTDTFPNWYTNLMFKKEGVHSLCDRNHKIVLRLNRKMEQPESDLFIDSAPLEILLHKLENGEWKDIDKMNQRIDLNNFGMLQRAFEKEKVWEIFYSLKTG